jgi:hypothetical protein
MLVVGVLARSNVHAPVSTTAGSRRQSQGLVREGSGTPKRTCALSLGRRGLKPGLIETGALSDELFAVDALSQAFHIAYGDTDLREMRLPGIHDLDDCGNFGSGLGRQQAECIALQHRVFERRVTAIRRKSSPASR